MQLYKVTPIFYEGGDKFNIKVIEMEITKESEKLYYTKDKNNDERRIKKDYLDQMTDHQTIFKNQFCFLTLDKSKVKPYAIKLLEYYLNYNNEELKRISNRIEIIKGLNTVYSM